MDRKFSKRDERIARQVSRDLSARQDDVVPIDVLIARRAKLYRGSPNWDDWLEIQETKWRVTH